jgi:ATP-binding cassette, subfamily B, bacterial
VPRQESGRGAFGRPRTVTHAGVTLPGRVVVTTAEFMVHRSYRTDRSSPVRWIVSHVRRQAWILPIILVGAFGNAALAAVVPVLIGEAFNDMQTLAASRIGASILDLIREGGASDLLLRTAVLVVLSQFVRAVLQLGRNFGTEVLAQRFERDARDELYGSLLGKSMTFHQRQSRGDTMARATNDVREINLMLNPGLNLVIGSANFLIMPLLVAPRYSPQLVLTPHSSSCFMCGRCADIWAPWHRSPARSDGRSAQ